MKFVLGVVALILALVGVLSALDWLATTEYQRGFASGHRAAVIRHSSCSTGESV